ncbi:MAG: hypothetical protein U1F77_16605 [Kiritimatiellia bacterium]
MDPMMPSGFWAWSWALISASTRSIAAWSSLLVLAGFALWAVWRSRKHGDHHAPHLFYGAAHLQVLFFLLAGTHEYVFPTVFCLEGTALGNLLHFSLGQVLLLFYYNLVLNLGMVAGVSVACGTRPRPGLPSICGAVAVAACYLVLSFMVLQVCASFK